MKTSNTPGFSAEASLLTTEEHYRQTMTLMPADRDSVRPATCYHDCISDCLSDNHVHPGVCIRFCRNECRQGA
jgi:hypothetical protein